MLDYYEIVKIPEKRPAQTAQYKNNVDPGAKDFYIQSKADRINRTRRQFQKLLALKLQLKDHYVS